MEQKKNGTTKERTRFFFDFGKIQKIGTMPRKMGQIGIQAAEKHQTQAGKKMEFDPRRMDLGGMDQKEWSGHFWKTECDLYPFERTQGD